MNRDKLVAMRNGMVIVLTEAIKLGNQGKPRLYNDTIYNIDSMDGYSAKRLEDEMEINGETYNNDDLVVLVYEGDKLIITVYRDKHDKLFGMEVDIEDLLTDVELEARRNMTPDDIIDGLMGKAVEPI